MEAVTATIETLSAPKPAQPVSETTKARERVESRRENLQAAYGTVERRIASLQEEIATLNAQSARNLDLQSAASLNVASSSTEPVGVTQSSMPFKSTAQKLKEAEQAKNAAARQIKDQETLDALVASLREFFDNSPVRLEGDPRIPEAIIDSLKRWFIGPERRGRRRERVVGLEAGFQVAAQRANLESTGTIPALRRLAEQAQQFGGDPFLRSMLGWIGKGMLRVISLRGPTRQVHHEEDFWLFRYLKITPADTLVKGLSSQCLRAERLAHHPAQRLAFRQLHDEIEQRKPELVLHMRKLLTAIAKGMRNDDIARMAREVAPRLVALNDRRIAELRNEQVRGSIPQTESARAATAATRDRQLQLPGEQLDIEQRLRAKEEELASAEARKRRLHGELTAASEQSADLLKREVDERSARRPPTKELSLEDARKARADLWHEIMGNKAVLGVITSNALKLAIERHVDQTPEAMTKRIDDGITQHTATFTSGATFLRVLREVAQQLQLESVSSSAGGVAAEPGKHREFSIPFQVGEGLARLSSGKDEKRKAWRVMVAFNEKTQLIDHIFPEVRTPGDRVPASQQRTLGQTV